MTRFIDVATMADLVAECGLETFSAIWPMRWRPTSCAGPSSTSRPAWPAIPRSA